MPSRHAFVTRFAPSPTGYLHLGHAFSALTAFQAAKAAGGRFLLRIEDIDEGRRRPEFEDAIYEDLAWLGLTWEAPVRRQSDHLADYQGALDRLIGMGVLYRDFRTRKELLAESLGAPHGPSSPVRGQPLPPAEEAEMLGQNKPFAWRLWLDEALKRLSGKELSFEADGVSVRADPALLGDAILARRDIPTSYHLASVHDDALQGVTDVIRGEDLREAAHLHALLQVLLGYPTPRYRHHRLILGAEGKRLAKRDQAQTLRSLRAGGCTPSDIRRTLGL